MDVATVDDDGRITHLVSYYDGAEIMRDLGLLPSAGLAGGAGAGRARLSAARRAAPADAIPRLNRRSYRKISDTVRAWMEWGEDAAMLRGCSQNERERPKPRPGDTDEWLASCRAMGDT